MTSRERPREVSDDAVRSNVRLPVIIDARRFDAVLFDLDGVITDTASVHARTWSHLFDEFLRRRTPRLGEDHSPFTSEDYRRHVDGRSRREGIREFLSSRGIALAEGRSAEEDAGDTVCGLTARKQRLFEEQLRAGITVFAPTVALVRRLHHAHIRTAVYSSSMNCRAVLQAAGIERLFEVRVDGTVAEQLQLKGKPDPALLLEAARRLGAQPERCVVVDDARPGVLAGRNGGFGMVIGVAAPEQADELYACGADVVVADLADVISCAKTLR